MLFYGITLIMKEKSNASALLCPLTRRVFKIQKKSRTIFDQINAITH